MTVPKPNIILDMDGTLITDKWGKPKARPYLKSFLNFCFKYFDKVGIWTAANDVWFNQVYREILHPILFSLKKKFHFIYIDKNTRMIEKNGTVVEVIKPLRNIWQRITKPYDSLNSKNTIIIDDTPEVCIQNKSSSIIVPSFTGNPKDVVLKNLQYTLSKIILDWRKEGDIKKSVKKNTK